MIYNKLLFKSGQAGFVLGAVLITLTGCVGYVQTPGAGIYMAPPVVEVGVQDEYVYYPGYDVYYNSNLHLYGYMDGGVWVSRPEPRGVSIDVLLASPSVRMDFHDSPANHRAEMARQYPRNWKPSGAPQAQRAGAQKANVQKAPAQKAQAKKAPAQKANGKDDKHEEHEAK